MDAMYDEYEYREDGDVEYAEYYEDDTYAPDADWEDGAIETSDEEDARPLSLDELYRYCVIPTFTDSYKHLLMLLSFALIFNITCRVIRLPRVVVHVMSLLSGGALVFQMFQWRCKYMLGLFGITYVPLFLLHRINRGYRGPATFVTGVIFLIVCENLFVDPLWWHAIRGIQMVILMKIVSVGYDLDSKRLDDLPNALEMAGYLGNPGSILFGPWISYSMYKNVLEPFKWNLWWLCRIVLKTAASGVFLIASTCFVNWCIVDKSSNWVLAFRDALSFRLSHYFVSYLSEVSSGLAGIDVGSVSKPEFIEFPRSIVEVVIYWNKPMHHWLKTYVFKPARLKVGIFGAIAITYGTSAMFHGLNFQLGAVLMSLGFYTFTEHGLRKKLALALDACVLARPCPKDCPHKSKRFSVLTVLVNGLFTLIAVFHLAYLGMMFDSSRGVQEQGYSMGHTMKKWSILHYTSHWISFGMFVLMSIL